MSLSCPWCYRRVTLDDIVIKDSVFAKSVRTCGRLIVQKRGRLCASTIEGRTGVEVYGRVEGAVRSGSRLYIGATGSVRGDTSAPSICIEPGGCLESPHTVIAPAADLPPADGVRGEHGGVRATGVHGHATVPESRSLPPAFDAMSARKAGEKLRVVLNLREGGWSTSPLPPNGMKRRR